MPGIRFDESMTSGFEDWDFWLQAIGRGFLGANYPFFGFEYRQRAESMLRDSNRTREGILTYIRQKHKETLRYGNIVDLGASGGTPICCNRHGGLCSRYVYRPDGEPCQMQPRRFCNPLLGSKDGTGNIRSSAVHALDDRRPSRSSNPPWPHS